MRYPNDLLTLGGRSYLIEQDMSGGHGHNWQTIPAEEIGEDDREIIAGEILDGKQESGRVRIVDRHYRWRRA